MSLISPCVQVVDLLRFCRDWRPGFFPLEVATTLKPRPHSASWRPENLLPCLESAEVRHTTLTHAYSRLVRANRLLLVLCTLVVCGRALTRRSRSYFPSLAIRRASVGHQGQLKSLFLPIASSFPSASVHQGFMRWQPLNAKAVSSGQSRAVLETSTDARRA